MRSAETSLTSALTLSGVHPCTKCNAAWLQAAACAQVTLSDLRLNLSPDVVELALALQSSVLQPLMQPPPDKCVLRFSHFRVNTFIV